MTSELFPCHAPCENGGSLDLRNVGILPKSVHGVITQPRRPWKMEDRGKCGRRTETDHFHGARPS